MSQQSEISMPITKASASIAAAVGAQVVDTGNQATSMFADLLTMTWPNIAAAAAAVYTVSMLLEFYWKRIWRPLLERWGWVKVSTRRVYTRKEWAAKMAAEETEHTPL